jgi:hypothetical protein
MKEPQNTLVASDEDSKNECAEKRLARKLRLVYFQVLSYCQNRGGHSGVCATVIGSVSIVIEYVSTWSSTVARRIDISCSARHSSRAPYRSEQGFLQPNQPCHYLARKQLRPDGSATARSRQSSVVASVEARCEWCSRRITPHVCDQVDVRTVQSIGGSWVRRRLLQRFSTQENIFRASQPGWIQAT